MANSLTIIEQKGLCSIQDLGRDSAQHLGFSGGGASDEFSFLFANQLLGNNYNAPALEVTLGQISLRCNEKCSLVITGADCDASINELPIKNNLVKQLNTGDVLTLKLPRIGLHSYIAFSGGIACQHFMDSGAQTHSELALGLCSPALKVGSEIHLCSGAETALFNTVKEPAVPHFHSSSTLTLRFMPSELWQQLSLKKQNFFLSQSYEILPQSNRMGYRLSSDVLFCAEQSSVLVSTKQQPKPLSKQLSKPVCYGSIQLPDNGQPIVLMKERQTIGGYPVLGTVMKTDLFRLSQKKPGEHIRFSTISIEQAQLQLHAFYQKFKSQK